MKWILCKITKWVENTLNISQILEETELIDELRSLDIGDYKIKKKKRERERESGIAIEIESENTGSNEAWVRTSTF